MKNQKISISENKRLETRQVVTMPLFSSLYVKCMHRTEYCLVTTSPTFPQRSSSFLQIKKKKTQPQHNPKSLSRTIANDPLWFTKLFFLLLIKIVFHSFSVNFSSTERSVELHFRWRDKHCTLEMLIDKKSDGFKVIETKLESEVSLFS